jgi:cytochrome b subunit of formate dehydrogenase
MFDEGFERFCRWGIVVAALVVFLAGIAASALLRWLGHHLVVGWH